MRKLFTLIALLAVFMGAKAEWVQDYKIDYSQNTGFPFYVMGYVPEWVDGVMTDYGSMYSYKTDDDMAKEDALKDGDEEVGTVTTQAGVTYHKIHLASAGWHQYFIADGIKTELDGAYTVKAMVKASEAVTINVNMGWGWGAGESASASVKIGTEWEEVEWEYSGIGGASCNLVAQPGGATATIEWKWVVVSHNQKAQRPTTWQEWLTNDGKPVVIETTSADIPNYMGNAEFGAWPDWALEKNEDGVNINWRGDRTGEICAWSIVRGKNIDPSQEPDPVKDPDGNVMPEGKPRPFPCDIEDDGTGNHVFVVHSTAADNQFADWQAWDNQFFIMSPKAWKSGDQLKIHFRYKADKPAKTNTQMHHNNPSWYLIWHAIGDVSFTEEWQEFDAPLTIADDMAGAWCIAFNLNAENKEPNTFYIDDISWQSMKLDEGYFVAASNTKTGIEYDFDNAIEFTGEDGVYTATVGEAGKENTWVNQVMISTIRGNDAAFKGATLKPKGTITGDEEGWYDYEEGSLAKISLPAAGVWQITINTEYKKMNFVKLEGEANKEAVDIVTNPEVLVIKGVERDDLADTDTEVRESEGGTGQTWDNQFFIVANRVLEGGEETVIEFDYVASVAAKTNTGTHAMPGEYRKNAVGDVDFTTEEQHFKMDYTVPAAGWGGDAITDAQSIAFDMAVIKEACDYTIKNVKWYLKDDVNADGKTMENLINATGTDNFKVKIGAGNAVLDWGSDTGISNVVNKNTESNAIYNLAGQRVSNDFKGIVVKNGKKYIAK